MNPCFPSAPIALRRKPLAICMATIFAVMPLAASAAAWVIDNCDEGSSGNVAMKKGTLRFAAEHAGDGELIDMSSLLCVDGKISLATGSIAIAQNSLTIAGPGAVALTIDGSADNPGHSGDYRIFTHTGSGTLVLSNIGLSGGHVYHVDASYQSRGGGIYSKGNVEINHVAISNCGATSLSNLARGGAIYALGNVKLRDSTLSNNGADAPVSAYGGGVYAKGKLTMDYSSLTGNTVFSPAGSARGGGALATGDLVVSYSTVSANHANGSLASARGGGLVVAGNVHVVKSTISGNGTDGNFGGLLATNDDSYAGNKLYIATSTLSGNTAAGIVGGAYTNAGTIFIEHSTIAFNTAAAGKIGTEYFAAGMAIGAVSSDTAIGVESSIMSNNTYGANENDLSVAINAISVIGQNNLARQARGVNFTFGGNTSACPLLGPLRDNGGLTMTHALLSGSPAIDTGNLVDADAFDQRGGANANGVLDYDRASGAIGDPNPLPDIGAYELQQDDVVFNAGFDGCP